MIFKSAKVFFVIFINLIFQFNIYSQNFVFTSEEAQIKETGEPRSSKAGFAEEDFRRGVQSYYRGNFNEAIIEFEKALSYLPSENIIMDWLAKAYYKTGLEGTALNYWKLISDNGYGGLLLQNKIEIVRERRIDSSSYNIPIKFTECGTYSGTNNENLIFSQPVSVLPNADGSFWVVSYGTNQLLKMDINGFVFEKKNGPIQGFDRPMDIIRLNDSNLLITEFAADRVSIFDKNGNYLKSFGKKGVSLGEFCGPQFADTDSYGNIYISDFGNGRINVFDNEGNPLFHFGNFSSPTGIAVVDSNVFVADSVKGSILRFDTSGNYLGFLCKEDSFIHPEAVKKWGNFLIVSDKNKIYSVDIQTGSIFENVSTGNAPSKLTCSVPDVNGNLIATDFLTNEIYVMSKLSELIGGLFVQIENVNSANFPNVVVDVKIENRNRQSLVGLQEKNFVITEDKNPVQNYKFLGASYVNQNADITLVIEQSPLSKEYETQIENAVNEIASSMNSSGVLRIVSAGRLPVTEFEGSAESLNHFSLKSLKNPASSIWNLDTAIRLSANALITGEKKRAIIFIGTGNLSEKSFEKYGLNDISTYLNNNSIIFSFVSVTQQSPSEEISYITNSTKGKQYYVYRKEGLKDIVNDIIEQPSGNYLLSFTSAQKTSFGQKYLPVEIEVHLMNRSGRDESGYFAPLE